MPLSLRRFLESVEAAVYRPDRPVATTHEITALQYALGARKTYPILHVQAPLLPDGSVSDIELVTNLGASRLLTARALGAEDHREFARAYNRRAAAGIQPEIARGTVPVQEVVLEAKDADLTRLPALTQHEGDPGPYLTAAHATTRDPDSGIDNTAIQRCWVKGPRFMSYFPYPASHNMRNLRKYWAKDEPCPIAFWIGHHPAILVGAQAKLNYPESHWPIAGGMAAEAVRLAPSMTHGDAIMVPADAEMVVEGWIPPGQMQADGPFGEYTGYMGPQVPAPVCEVTCITHRRNPLYHDFGSGLPDSLTPENMVTEGKLFEMVTRVAPSLVNVHVPVSGRRFHVYLTLDRPAPGEARDALTAAMSYRRTKAAFAFDPDIDIFDPDQVLWALATRVQWQRDSFAIDGLQTSLLDPSLPAGSRTASKIGVDATVPAPARSNAPPPVPPRSRTPETAMEKARALLGAGVGDGWPAL